MLYLGDVNSVGDNFWFFEDEITDLKRYHFECKCLPDNTVSVRIFEYDSQIALDNSSEEVLKYETKTIFNEGRLSEKKEMVREMFYDGQPIEKIAKYARETRATIQGWINEADG